MVIIIWGCIRLDADTIDRQVQTWYSDHMSMVVDIGVDNVQIIRSILLGYNWTVE